MTDPPNNCVYVFVVIDCEAPDSSFKPYEVNPVIERKLILPVNRSPVQICQADINY